MPKSRSIDITEGFLKTEDIANTYENLSLLTVKGNLTIEGGLTFPDNTLQTTANVGITVQDEGSTLSTAATTLNFVGSGVVASGTGSTKTITINLPPETPEADTLATVTGRGATTTTTSVIPFYYANQAAFPNATTYHGAIAHSHSDGAMYFAHSGTWNRLANASELGGGGFEQNFLLMGA